MNFLQQLLLEWKIRRWVLTTGILSAPDIKRIMRLVQWLVPNLHSVNFRLLDCLVCHFSKGNTEASPPIVAELLMKFLQILCKEWWLRKIQKGFRPSVKGALLMTRHIQWAFECIHCMCGHACHYVCANDPQGLLLSFDHLVPRNQTQVIGFGSRCSYTLTHQLAVKETF